MKRGWADATRSRPSTGRATGADPDIRFLDREELEALLRAVPDDELGPTDRALYLAAAMTGLRQGELLALRWRDVDWAAGVVRVRRSYTRGQFGTPKRRRSSRAVPLADRLAGELERHFQRIALPGRRRPRLLPPRTGGPYDASRMRKRFKEALERGRGARGALPRPAPHVRHRDGGGRRAAAGDPGVDGPPRLQDDAIYADYAPDPSQGAAWAAAALRRAGTNSGTKLSTSESNSAQQKPLQ